MGEKTVKDIRYCTNVEILYINRGSDVKKIEELTLGGSVATGYSVLKTCTSLIELSLEETNISKSEDIIGLPKLKVIDVHDTPLAENPKEIKKLQEAYPDAKIYWE